MQAYRPSDTLDLRMEWTHEIEHVQALTFPLRRLIGDLATYLAGRDGGVQRFVLGLEHRDAPPTRVSVGLLAAERDAALLFECARGRLERQQLPQPVVALRLIARELPPFVPAGRDLFDTRPANAMPLEQLRERLRARLGADAVQQLQRTIDPRPERAQAFGRNPHTAPATETLPRPTWLLERPIPLRGPSRHPAGRPRTNGNRLVGRRRSAPRLLRRAYRQGQRAWVFCAVRRTGPAGCCTAGSHERRYAELHCLSNFSSSAAPPAHANCSSAPSAAATRALAITDECSLAGIVRAHEAARDTGVALIVGSEFQLADGPKLVLLVEDQDGYTALCRLITRGRRAPPRADTGWSAKTSMLMLPRPGRHAGAVAARCRRPSTSTAAGCATCSRSLLAGGRTASRPGRRAPTGAAAAAGRTRWACRWSPAATCTCTCGGGVRCRICSPRSVTTAPWPKRARSCSRTANAICARATRWRRSIRAKLLAESVRIAQRCTFDLDKLRYRYPARTGARGPHADQLAARADRDRACAGAGPMACRRRCAHRSSTNWR